MDPVWLNTMNITGDAATSNSSSTNNSHLQLQDLSALELLDSHARTSLVLLYSATSFVSFVGNMVVIIVETFGRRSAANLRKFLINLAISDILFGCWSVPFTYTGKLRNLKKRNFTFFCTICEQCRNFNLFD